jgi:hypothetical protein
MNGNPVSRLESINSKSGHNYRQFGGHSSCNVKEGRVFSHREKERREGKKTFVEKNQGQIEETAEIEPVGVIERFIGYPVGCSEAGKASGIAQDLKKSHRESIFRSGTPL